jgi:hypothetical protein
MSVKFFDEKQRRITPSQDENTSSFVKWFVFGTLQVRLPIPSEVRRHAAKALEKIVKLTNLVRHGRAGT